MKIGEIDTVSKFFLNWKRKQSDEFIKYLYYENQRQMLKNILHPILF